MNTELRKQVKNDFEKGFYKLMNNSVFGKTTENVTSIRDFSVRTKLSCKKMVFKSLLAIEMKNIQIKMNKPVYLRFSILQISKTLMYRFWYDYMKPKYGDHVKLCYMDTDSFIMHIKTEDFYKDVADDVEKRLDTSNYGIDHYL